MLAALAATAITGVFAVLLASGDMLGQLMGTCFATAILTGLMLPLSFLTDRPKFRLGGLVAMGMLTIAWLCILGLIWSIGHGFGHGLEWRLASTFGFTLLAGLPAAGALLLKDFPATRIAAWPFVGLAAFAWLGCIFGSWFPANENLAGYLWGTVLIPYGVGSLCCMLLINVGMGDRRHFFRWPGITVGFASIVLFIIAVWNDADSEFFARLGAAALSVCAALAYINLILMSKLRGNQQWLKWLTIGFTLISGICFAAAALTFDDGSPTEVLLRAAAAAGITALCGSIALIVLTVLNQRVDAPMIPSVEMTHIHLRCPRCESDQHALIGDAVCTNCQLQIFTRVTEPQCPACGYNLYKLTSNRCPECGADVGPPAPAILAVEKFSREPIGERSDTH